MPIRPFLPKRGWIVRVTALGEYSGQAAESVGVSGEVKEAARSPLGGNWISLVLDTGERFGGFVSAQCRVSLLGGGRVVA